MPVNLIKKNIPINRKINILKDFKALILLFLYFKKENFSLVFSITPKAGFLSILASFTQLIPNRIHIFTGQVWATKKGFRRFILKKIDKLIARFATTILIDSNSQRNFLIEEGVVLNNKSIVLGDGSISGVNLNRFKFNQKKRNKIREKFGFKDSTFVLLFLGRINKEKGILILAEAFSKLQKIYPDLQLWIVGKDEEQLASSLQKIKSVYVLDFSKFPEDYMMAADLFCQPSFREGFGTSVIEAASCGIPSIVSDIYGLKDAIINDETGILFPVGSSCELEVSLQRLIDDKILRKKMGKLANERVKKKFSQNRLTDELIFLFNNLLE